MTADRRLIKEGMWQKQKR